MTPAYVFIVKPTLTTRFNFLFSLFTDLAGKTVVDYFFHIPVNPSSLFNACY